MKEAALQAQKVLSQQIFSMQMTETLINDLLDLAKLENEKFQLNTSYFSLIDTIHSSFQILIKSAIIKKVTLAAEIDNMNQLQVVNLIHGD